MTAPDSRDSVERVVAEMRIPHEGGWDNDDVAALADRLQALARGPQQAGGEDYVEDRYCDDLLDWLWKEAGEQSAQYQAAAALMLDRRALQAEVARLTGANDALADALREANKGYVHELNRAETAEAALREAGRDAERYRRIRNGPHSDYHGDIYAMVFEPDGDEPIDGAGLDAAIDRALARDAALNGGQDDA